MSLTVQMASPLLLSMLARAQEEKRQLAEEARSSRDTITRLQADNDTLRQLLSAKDTECWVKDAVTLLFISPTTGASDTGEVWLVDQPHSTPASSHPTPP